MHLFTLKSLRIFATMMETPLNAAPMTPVMGLAWPAFHGPPVFVVQDALSCWVDFIIFYCELFVENIQMNFRYVVSNLPDLP